MAAKTKTKSTRRSIRRRGIALFYLYSIFVFLFALGFLLGRLSKPNKKEVVTIVKEQYITPVESNNEQLIVTKYEDVSSYYNVPLEKSLQADIKTICDEENVPVELIYSMINTESNFDPNCISKTNDYGLMQINKTNHEWLQATYGVKDFLNPTDNVYCGVKIISSYLNKYHDYNKALMCYNMGENGAKSLWEKGIESSSYSRNIVANMSNFKEIDND